MVPKPIEVQVRCSGQMHKIVLNPNGQLSFPNHKTEDTALGKDDLIVAFGGKECRCNVVRNAWRKKDFHPLPKELALIIKGLSPHDRHWRRWLAHQGVLVEPSEYVSVKPNSNTLVRENELTQHIINALVARNHSVKWDTSPGTSYTNNVPTDVIHQIDGIDVNVRPSSAYYGEKQLRLYVYDRVRVSHSYEEKAKQFPLRNAVLSIERYIFDAKMDKAILFDTNSKENTRALKMIKRILGQGLEASIGTRKGKYGFQFDIGLSVVSPDDALSLANKLNAAIKGWKETTR